MDGAARQRAYVARQKANNLKAYRAKKAAAEKARRRRQEEKQAEQAKEGLSIHLASVVAELLGPEERARLAEERAQVLVEVPHAMHAEARDDVRGPAVHARDHVGPRLAVPLPLSRACM